MSSSGITPINSGPLLIRTCLDSSPNNTYLLTQYELPVSSNYVLITSSNGLLAPSDSIYVSSLSVSSMIGSTAFLSTLTTSNIMTSTLSGSTTTLTTIRMSSMAGSSIQATAASFASTVTTSSISTANVTFSTLFTSTMAVDQVTLGTQLNAATSSDFFSTITFATLTGNGTILSNTISTTSFSTLSVSTVGMILTYFSSVNVTASSLSTTTLSYQGGQGSTLTIRSLGINSTLTVNTINAVNLSFSTVFGTSTSNNIITSNLTTSTLIVSTLIANTLTYSTMIGSTATVSSLLLSVGTYSTMNGSTIVASTVNVSTSNTGFLFASSITVSSMITSTVSTNAYGYSTMLISTAIVPIFYGSIVGYSTMIGSTLTTSTLSVTSLLLSTLSGSTSFLSTMAFSTLTSSTLLGNSTFMTQLPTSSITGATLLGANLTTSTSLTPSLAFSTLYGSTLSVSTLTLPIVNNLTIGQGAGGVTTNTALGYQTLGYNTGNNNTAMGYTAMYANTSGSYNTAFGQQTLYYNTTGSYNTAVGSNAGFLTPFTGNYNTYLGFNAYPSNSTVTNEIVIGNSYSYGTSNTGIGANSVVLGNPGITLTRLYGNVGINTNNPGATLDVRGGYYQYGGSTTITNSQPTVTSVIKLVNDGAVGLQFFLNGASRSLDGGPTTATVRNDAGTLRLQGGGTGYNKADGITILSSGNVGINNANPTFVLDVVGGIRCAADGVTGNSEGYYSTGIYVVAPSGTTANASIWMGYDPTNDCGYINSARANSLRPINIQTQGGYLGIGTGVVAPGYQLDVNGGGRFTGNLTVGSSTINCGSLTVNGTVLTTSQWSGASGATLTYNKNVTVTGTVTAGSYSNLPAATASVIGIMNPASTGLSVSSGVMNISLPFFFGVVSGIYNTYYTFSAIQSYGFSQGYNNVWIVPDLYGYYLLSFTGNTGGTSLPNPFTIYGSTGYSFTTTTPGLGSYYNPYSMTVVMRMAGPNQKNISIYAPQGNYSAGTQQITITWLAPL